MTQYLHKQHNKKGKNDIVNTIQNRPNYEGNNNGYN